MKSCLRKFQILNTKKFIGGFRKSDFTVLLNGFLAIRASKTGLSISRSQVYGALEKVRIPAILFVYDTNGLMCTSWVWQNNDSVSKVNHSSLCNSLTVNRTAVIDAAKEKLSELKSPVVFFYCDYEYNDELDASFIVSSFIKQICEFLYQQFGHYPNDVASDLQKFFGSKRTRPDFDDLQDVFSRLCRVVPDAIYIVDGVDALQEAHAIRFLKFIQRLFCSPDASQRSRILLLSRDQVPGYINIGTFIHGICQISISTNAMQDIENYIESTIEEKLTYRKLTDDVSLLNEIKKTLLIESSNMYESNMVF